MNEFLLSFGFEEKKKEEKDLLLTNDTVGVEQTEP